MSDRDSEINALNDISVNRPIKNIMLYMLFIIQLSILPIYLQLPPIVILLVLLFSGGFFYLVYKNKPNPGKFFQIISIITVVISLFVIYGHLLGQQPGVSLIILMTLLKLFETKAIRDCYVIVYSCLFIIASTFFQSQSVWLILYVTFVVTVLTTALILLSDRRRSVPLDYLFQLAARFVVLAIPMMLILFVLFPRIPGPLWALPKDAFSAQTGLSEEMSPGSINSLISSSAIAFRVKFDGGIPVHSQRYWRGAVLTNYDGKTWRRDDASKKAAANLSYDINSKSRFSYTVTLEPTSLNWLLSLEYADIYNTKYSLNREAMLLVKEKVNKVLSYKVVSQTDAKNQALFVQESYKNRLLPIDLNEKSIEFVKMLLQKSNYDKQQYVKNVLQYFRDEAFVYTLKPDLLGVNAIDDFIFNSKRGFCEHYASAFTYLMRLAGIPARVVIGYQGGRMNPLDDYMIVRQSDAHAWTEVWLDDHWKRIDPTAVVSPERIEQGVQSAGLDVNRLPMLLMSESAFLKNAAFLYDSFQNNWNQWVIGFDRSKQDELLKLLGLEKATVSNLILLLVASLTLTGLVVAWFLLKQNDSETDRIQKYYNLFCKKLKRYGVERQRNEGPADLERRVLQRKTISHIEKENIRYIFKAYRLLHYGNKVSEKLQKNYIKKIKGFSLSK